MSKIPKIYQLQRLSFAPMVINLDNEDQTFYNSNGTLLTTMLKKCSDFLCMKTPLSLQHQPPSEQHTIVNS